jgi:hypothetical protein
LASLLAASLGTAMIGSVSAQTDVCGGSPKQHTPCHAKPEPGLRRGCTADKVFATNPPQAAGDNTNAPFCSDPPPPR